MLWAVRLFCLTLIICFYGLATVVEKFDAMKNEFGSPEITITKDLPMACGGID